jgi:hypothetical protein
VRPIIVRYLRLICNTRECRVARHTAVFVFSVPHACTPVCVHPHLNHTYLPTQHSVACTWWTPRSVRLRHDYASTRLQPHTLGMSPSYFGETPPRTLGRRPSYFGETPLVLWGDAPRTLGRQNQIQPFVFERIGIPRL